MQYVLGLLFLIPFLSGCEQVMKDFLSGGVNSETPELSFTIDQPTESTLFKGGSAVDISWTMSADTQSVANIKIDYSHDNGATWTVADAAASNSGSFSWTSPTDDSTECLIRLTAIHESGETVTAVSKLFGLDSTPPVIGANQIGPDQITVAEDGTVNFSLNAASDGNPGVVYEVVSSVSAGTLSGCLTSGSSVNCTYVPTSNDDTSTSFTYKATDDVGNVSTAAAQV